MPKCLSKGCGDNVSKRMVTCAKHWGDLTDIRKEAIRKTYSRDENGLKFIDMLVNGDLTTVKKIVTDKDFEMNSKRKAKAFVDLSEKPAEEVKVIYKVKV